MTLQYQTDKFFRIRGVATLPTVIVLSLMSLAVVVSITSVAFNEQFISQGQIQSTNALFYAEQGARDALLRIVRNKNYVCSAADCYSIDFVAGGCANSTGCAKVSVSYGIGTTADPKIITSNGIMKSSHRRLQVSVVLDNGTTAAASQKGEVTSVIWSELTN